MQFSETIQNLKKELDEEMAHYIETRLALLLPEDVFLRDALEAVRQVVLGGGKRVRGALLYQGYLAAGGTNPEAALRAAAGMEFIHAYLLVHDDVMDKDNIRHGVPTLHTRYKEFSEKYFPEKDSVHFGNSIAVILGDMLCAWGNDCIFGVDLPRESVQKAIQEMQTVVYRTGVGQMKDMYIEFAGTATEEEILRMYEDKTARYTIEAPLKIGTLLAGGNAPLENFFAHYALPLGIAFQLQDDLLGLFGQEKDLGKRVGADIIEGKFTFLMQKTWERVDETERRELKELLQRGEDITLAEIERVRTLASDSGARALTEEKVESLIQEAEGVLAREGDILDPEVHEFLSGMAAYIGKRKD